MPSVLPAIVDGVFGLFYWTWFAAAARDINVNVSGGGDSFWQTAIVAVGAALLGSAVGGYASFRANEALERRRRQARAKIRRKAKVYTPIRTELVALQAARESRTQFNLWGIVRETPPNVLRAPASLHLWKDLVEDGRSLTAASKQIQTSLDAVDTRADEFNQRLSETRAVFEERGMELLAAIGEEPRVMNWVETDTSALLAQEFDDLNITGVSLGNNSMSADQCNEFEKAWKSDEAIADATKAMLDVDAALGVALDQAIADLEAAMQRIAKKYESESPDD